MTLGAVTDEGKGVILEELLELLTGPIGTLVDILLDTGEVNGLDTTDGGDDRGDTGKGGSGSDGRARESCGNDRARSGRAGKAEGTGKTTRSHCEDMEERRVESEGERRSWTGEAWEFK